MNSNERIHERVSKLETQFGKNYNESIEAIYLSSDELKGCEQSFLDRTFEFTGIITCFLPSLR